MNVHMYHTTGGKNLLKEYLDKLPVRDSAEGYYILNSLEKEGLKFLEILDTRQIDRKLWEIRFPRHNRIFYVMLDGENIFLLHGCRKQKGKAEKQELDKALKRMKKLIG